VQALVPPPDEARLAEALRRGQAYLQRLGIGAWLDAWIDPVVAADPEAAYLALLGAGELTGRAMLALRWDASRGLEQVEELRERCRTIEAAGGPLVQAKAVKLFVDGVVESSTAFLLAPYDDRSSADAGGVGDPLYEPETLRSIAVALHQAGFDLHLHAIGDAAVRCALDAIEAARQAGPARDARHTIAHLEMVDDDDIERFAAVDAIAACQPLWAVHDETDLILTQRLDAQRLERRYPFGRLRDAGATLALGSDWNVSTADPLRILHVATTRTPPDTPETPPLGPARERLTLEEGLLAYTAGSARVNRLEATCAQITVGKAADLVLLDHDPLGGGVPLTECHVAMTMVDGRVVYAR
jgi:predicted amidohydrolase YtcJ